MTTIDYTGLRLTGALCINRLTALELHVGVNEHGWAVVEGEAGENALEQLQGAVAGREQVIMVRDETGAEQPLFAGVIHSAGLITYGGYNRFRIELQSGTIQMDQVKRSRSFQDVAQTYSQVAQRVASGYEDGAVIPTVGLDKPLEVPVIQYRETDWEFLKRMASWCGGVVVPETHYAYPRIWFGFPDRAFTCTFPEDCYTSGISQRYYELGGPAAGNRRADFFYYDVPSSQMCDLGWYTVFRGQEFLICEKWAKLERGELLFTYRLGKPGLGYGRKEYNDRISGMTILGEVLSTKRETVCLKLDIDQGWAPGGPYPYTWRPETGNMMYCMPQVGTRVSLYFPNCDEQAAIAVNCVRTNGSSCARMSDPSRRSFVTEHGKEMNLYPEEISLINGQVGSISLLDESGVFAQSQKSVSIYAKKKIIFRAPSVYVATPVNGELKFVKCSLDAGMVSSSFILSNIHDVKTKRFTSLEGRIQKSYAKFADAPKLAKPDNLEFRTQLFGNAVFGFFAVGALVIVGVVAAAIAGVALATVGVAAACVMGATAIGAVVITEEDAMDGEARSLGEATLDMIGWGLQGLMFFVGGTAFMGLKGIVSAAPYVGQLTSRQIITAMIGNGITQGLIGGAANFLLQITPIDSNTSESIDENVNWESINSSISDGILSGIMAVTGLGVGAQVVFNAAMGAHSKIQEGGRIDEIILSAIVGGKVTSWGGSGLLVDRTTFNHILQEIRESIVDSSIAAAFSESVNKLYELLDGIRNKGQEEGSTDESLEPSTVEG